MFSKSCEYGLRAILYVAQQSAKGEKVNLLTIANEINSPTAFTAKILQKLTKAQLIHSVKGPYGGFEIEPSKMKTKLIEVVAVLDGNTVFEGCGLGLKKCDKNSPCPLHNNFVEIRKNLKQMLESTSLDSLTNELENEKFTLKR